MSTIQLKGMSGPINYKNYVQENQRNLKTAIIKLVALSALGFFVSVLILYTFAGCSLTTALTKALFSLTLPQLPTRILQVAYGFFTGLFGFSTAFLLFNLINFRRHSQLIKNLDTPKKEDALIIQSPGMDIHISTQKQLAEKYNLKIYEISSTNDFKSILSSFPKDSLKLALLRSHGCPEYILLSDKKDYNQYSRDCLYHRNYQGQYFSNLDDDCTDDIHFQRLNSKADRFIFKLYDKALDLLSLIKNIKKREKPWRELFQSLDKQCPIILHSCSTAKGEENIAKKISEISQRTVIGSSADVQQGEGFDTLEIGDLDTSHIKFWEPRHIRIWKNFGISIPFTAKDTTVVYKKGKLA